jgi:ACS family sodium-dependent inorganic phosphate cotransporter
MATELGWDEPTKGLVMASFYAGYLTTQILGGWLANRYGGKVVLGVAVIFWSFFTLITPLAAAAGISLLLIARVLMGMGEGVAYPSMFSLLAKWTPMQEKSRASALCHSAGSLGLVTALMVAPWLASQFGWPSIFYAFGASGFLWAIAWWVSVSSTPASHPKVSAAELRYITGGETSLAMENSIKHNIPYRQLLSKPAILAVFFNHFCFNWGLFVLISWLPSYFSGQLDVEMRSMWIYAVPPWLTLFAATNVAGAIADRAIAAGISVIRVRTAAQTIGMLGPAAGLFVLSGATSAPEAVIVLSFVTGLSGFALVGFGTNFLDVAPRYAGVLWGVSSTFATIPGILGVLVTGWLVGMTGTYSSAFLLTAAMYSLGILVWYFFASGEQIIE